MMPSVSNDQAGRLSRRGFLRISVAGALTVTTASLLAACSAQAPTAPAAPAAAPAAQPTTAAAAPAGAATPTPATSGVEQGVQTTGQAAAGQIKIEYYGGWTGPDGLTMKDMVNQHNATGGDNIFTVLSIYDWDTMFAKMVAGFAAKSPPDMAGAHHKDIPQYVAKGLIQEMDDQFIKDSGIDPNDVVGTLWQDQVINGKHYSLPLDVHPMALYVNLDLFKKEGIDVLKNPPTTREMFLDYAKKLTKTDAGGNITQMGYPVAEGYWQMYTLWWTTMYQNGGAFASGDKKKATMNSPEAIEAAQFVQDLVYKYKVSPPGITDSDKEFLTGKAAMYMTGPWWINGFTKQEGLNFETLEVPMFGNKKKAVWGANHVLYLLKSGNAERTAAASKMIKWLSDHTGKGGWTESGMIPARKSLWPLVQELPHRAAFMKSFDYLQDELFPMNHFQEIFVYTKQSPLLIAMQSIMGQDKKAPEAALTELAGQVQKVLDKEATG
jgi:multiple sugar transport system substrate-binding protein